ncbi:hypothetical protein MYAM1_000724 [Malassezia yamatoensis]|uniref:CTLH/CRA C-terminal to LisH motif domain-containing protein n=1 Tax=Malassezia yamatoensis TaxID=253288 RepID=A0AAJ5YRM5_9BASI|nr:hypothetical protein MYAM1_000724 [Malassezia yamatoensis]
MDTIHQGIGSVRDRIPSYEKNDGDQVKYGAALKEVDALIEKIYRGSELCSTEDTLRAELEKANQGVSEANRHYYVALNKLWRSVQKKYPSSLDSMIDPKLFKSDTCTYALDTVVLDYLLRAGETDIAAEYSRETGVYIPEAQKVAILELSGLSRALQNGDTAPILRWATANSQALRDRHSPLEYDLLRNKLLCIAQGNAVLDEEDSLLATGPTTNVQLAFAYGRRHFVPYLSTHLEEIQCIYTLLLFLPKFRVSAKGTPLKSSMNAEGLLSYVPWKYRALILSLRFDMRALFTRFHADYCAINRLSRPCALQASVDVGVNNALGRIHKVRSMMKDRHNEWSQANELPVSLSTVDRSDRNSFTPRTQATQHISMSRF